jgi:hypothetical protein
MKILAVLLDKMADMEELVLSGLKMLGKYCKIVLTGHLARQGDKTTVYLQQIIQKNKPQHNDLHERCKLCHKDGKCA